jgi:hypothetical protein
VETLKLLFAVFALLLAGSNTFAREDSLFAQSAGVVLSKVAASGETRSRTSWLLLDAQSGQLLASGWPDADEPIPMGSLTKPFVALAYSQTHHDFPRYTCGGTAGRCWLPHGHGTLDFRDALAFSCNSYFLQLAAETSPSAIDEVTREYGLVVPPVATPAQLIGLDSAWRIAPLALGRAYAKLATQPAAGPVAAGMREAATRGTANALAGENAMAKTGTAHCIRDCLASGDGFVVAITPSGNARLLLLVRERGTTGAATAAIAAQMLRGLRDGHVIDY